MYVKTGLRTTTGLQALLRRALGFALAALLGLAPARALSEEIIYITAKADLPFWDTVAKGVKSVAASNGYEFLELDSNLNADLQLAHVRRAIERKAAGIVISPTNSNSAKAALALANKANLPVAIADIGTQGGDYVSFVKSDNYRGSYDVGAELASALKAQGWTKASYAMVTIELTRKNGQERTAGFRDAMQDAGFAAEVALRQMKDYSAEETYRHVREILLAHPQLNGLFIETDQPVDGAMRAIREAGKEKQVLLVSFDAMPGIVHLLKGGDLVAVGMQQPFLMGDSAAQALVSRLHGRTPAKEILVPILVATDRNIDHLMPIASKTVFGEAAR